MSDADVRRYNPEMEVSKLVFFSSEELWAGPEIIHIVNRQILNALILVFGSGLN